MIVDGGVLKTAEDAQEEVVCSKVVSSEAPEGNTNSHIAADEIITIDSSTSSDTRSSPTSVSSSSSTSSDMDDVPLNKVYTTLNKSLSPSPSTKTSKKPNYDSFVPMYPFVEERLIDMQLRRIDVCKNLPVDHPLQPRMIDPIQFVHADAEGVDDHTGTYIANIDVSSSQPSQTSEPSIIQNLVNHYSGELPEYETNLEKAFDIASDEVMTESPQQHEPDQEMASSTNTNYVLIPDLVPEQNVPELVVPEQPASELIVPKQVINNQSPTTNTITQPETSINDQPSSSNLAIQPCAPARTNVPSSPSLFLDSTILADVCENIFQELNNLVQARNNLINEDSYEKLWKRLKERVDYVLN